MNWDGRGRRGMRASASSGLGAAVRVAAAALVLCAAACADTSVTRYYDLAVDPAAVATGDP